MRARVLGRSGIATSEIGFGCGPTAGLMLSADAALRRAAVTRALEVGITLFDTAPVYGEGRSERNLGTTLRELDAAPVVATKVALEEADFGDIAGAVVRSVSASLERLGLERVPLVNLHNRVGAERRARADFGSGALLCTEDVLGPGGVVEGLERLRAAGAIGAAGCSGYGGSVPAIEALIESAAFDVIMVNYSMLNQTSFLDDFAVDPRYQYGRVGQRAANAGMGVIALRVLEAGALAQDASRAIRFALTNQAVGSALVGFSNLREVDAAADAAEAGSLSELDLIEIEKSRVGGYPG